MQDKRKNKKHFAQRESLAAENLLQAIQCNSHPIQKENYDWLATHYYQKMNPSPTLYTASPNHLMQDTHYQKASYLLHHLLIKNQHLIPFSADNHHLVEATIQLSHLLQKEDLPLKVAILEELNGRLKKDEANKPLFQQGAFELAKAYEQSGDRKRAFKIYESLYQEVGDDSLIGASSQFHAHRLATQFLSKREKRKNHPLMIASFNLFKELQIKKHPSSEPLHLEAALEYALLRKEVAPEKEASTTYLFFLKRIKEDYQNRSDPIVNNYQLQLKQFPEKERLYHLYMDLIDEQIAAIEQGSQEVQTGAQLKESPYLTHYLDQRLLTPR